MQNTLTSDEKRQLQKRLKEAVSNEYAKKKKGMGGKEVTYLGSETLIQVLNEVVPGGWSFEIVERFREEMYIKPDKHKNQFEFAGYSYSVHGRLTIDGLGTRDQFGAKEGQGNKGVDTNAYKAATSSALVKCAALFDIGRDIYTSENEQYKAPEEEYAQQQQWAPQQGYENVVQMPQQQQWAQDPYQQQQAYPQQGQGQQPFFAEPQYMSQAPFMPQEQVQQAAPDMQYFMPQQEQAQPQMQYVDQGMQQPIPQEFPQAFQQPMNVAPPATEEQKEMLPQEFWNPAENLMQTQTQQQPDFPFENVPPKQEEKKGTFDERFISKEAPSMIAEFTQHRQRLGLMQDKDLNATLRDYFKDANASIASVTNETISGVVEYFRTLQAV